MIETMGFQCIGDLNQAKLKKLIPKGEFSDGDHLEFDYLIPDGRRCFVGEITARSTAKSVKSKYQKVTTHISLLKGIKLDEDAWLELGVQKQDLHLFRQVRELCPFMMVTKLERFDVDLGTGSIPVFFRSDLSRLVDYADSIGAFSQKFFLRAFPKKKGVGVSPLLVNQHDHDLIVSVGKTVSSYSEAVSDIFTFEVCPYKLLNFAEVFSNDSLPNLSDDGASYQRPLIPQKLENIRKHLLKNRNFMFPNAILVVLSEGCSFDQDASELKVVDEPDAMTVIDGQHRLFSYASLALKHELEGQAQILVTAIKFDTDSPEEVVRNSARAFVEINSNQTAIDSTHIDSISFDILGEINSKSMAAKVLLELNNRPRKPFHGLFKASYTNLGVIRSKTVLGALSSLLNVGRIEGDAKARSGTKRATRFIGYERLMDVSEAEASSPDIIVSKAVSMVEKYGSHLKKTFPKDWPKRNVAQVSSFGYSKMMAALFKLLGDFLAEGLEWDEVKLELEKIKKNVLKLSGGAPDKPCFKLEHPELPDANWNQSEMFKFLQSMR